MPDVTLVNDPVSEGRFILWLTSRSVATGFTAVDTETTGLDPWHDELRLVQFGDSRQAFVLPYPQHDKLLYWALSRGIPMVGQNTKFDAQFLANAALPIDSLVDDTRIMGHLLDSGTTTALKPMADRYLGAGSSESQADLKELMRKNKWTFATVPVDTFEYWYYAGMDTILTARLAGELLPRVQRSYSDLYDMEVDVWQALQRAEQRGICIDREYVEDTLTDLEEKIGAIELRYPDINLGSGKQLAELLTAEGVRVPTTSTGRPSLTKAVLDDIKHPIVADVLEHRRLTKLASTYFESFLNLEVDGRIHTTINPLGARTGRMSSERPNLQNVPKRNEGSFVRRAFISGNDRVMVLIDYKQIEYRIFASYCQEPGMIQAFLDGKDMHAVTAEMALGHEPDEHERLIAKNANFAELYMAGIDKFARTAGITTEEARRFKKAYHAEFTRVKPFTKAVIKYAQSNSLSVETKFGRNIPVDADHLYAGVNYMIQGTAADVLKRAIVRIADTEWDQYFVLPVHDELIFDVPLDRVDDAVRELPKLMEDHETFDVPLTVDVTTAPRWGEEDA